MRLVRHNPGQLAPPRIDRHHDQQANEAAREGDLSDRITALPEMARQQRQNGENEGGRQLQPTALRVFIPRRRFWLARGEDRIRLQYLEDTKAPPERFANYKAELSAFC